MNLKSINGNKILLSFIRKKTQKGCLPSAILDLVKETDDFFFECLKRMNLIAELCLGTRARIEHEGYLSVSPIVTTLK